jgi:hypothetical protein
VLGEANNVGVRFRSSDSSDSKEPVLKKDEMADVKVTQNDDTPGGTHSVTDVITVTIVHLTCDGIGLYDINFVCKAFGRYLVTVLVHGQPIPASPKLIQVSLTNLLLLSSPIVLHMYLPMR